MKISAKEILCSQNPRTDILAQEILQPINTAGFSITLTGAEGLGDCCCEHDHQLTLIWERPEDDAA